MAERILIFDTTLRDGEQSPGATMSLKEKVLMAQQLELLGVDILEAGFAASSPGDLQAVATIAKEVNNIQIASLARAMPADIDKAWEALQHAKKPRIHIFLATSALHMKYKLCKSPSQVLEMIYTAVSHAKNYTPNIEFSAEDASRSDVSFLVEACNIAIEAGATTVNIPDTVGYAQPEEYGKRIKHVVDNINNKENVIVSVHCHNDLGLAVANSLAAVQAGARQLEVTVSGIGERAGNAALEEVVMALNVRKNYYNCETGIITEHIFPTTRMLSRIIGQPIALNKPIVGGNAFAHESGIHQDGVLKNRETYEIMTPESIGIAKNSLVLGKHSGRSAIKSKLDALGYALNDTQVDTVFTAVKNLADKKREIYDADIEAVVLEEVYRIPDKYRLVHLSVHSSNTGVPPTASIIMDVAGEEHKQVTFGMGTIDAMMNAIAKITGSTATLKHYSVSAITGGSDALGEVTIVLTSNGDTSVGRGSDHDVVTASAKAYINALNRLAKKQEEA